MENTNGRAVEGTEESMNGTAQAGTAINDINVQDAVHETVSENPLNPAEEELFALLRETFGLQDAGALVVAERIRHLTVEDHRIAADLNYSSDTLSNAAVAYALKPTSGDIRKDFWPFDPASFKPADESDRVRDLVKAAALLLAAIDAINISKLLDKSYNGEGQAKSSQVNHIAYNPSRQVLLVTFASGGSYEYANIDVQTYSEAYRSESIGKWINSVLKAEPEKYTYKKL